VCELKTNPTNGNRLCKLNLLLKSSAGWPKRALNVSSANVPGKNKKASPSGSSRKSNQASVPVAKPTKKYMAERPTNQFQTPKKSHTRIITNIVIPVQEGTIINSQYLRSAVRVAESIINPWPRTCAEVQRFWCGHSLSRTIEECGRPCLWR